MKQIFPPLRFPGGLWKASATVLAGLLFAVAGLLTQTRATTAAVAASPTEPNRRERKVSRHALPVSQNPETCGQGHVRGQETFAQQIALRSIRDLLATIERDRS